MRKKAGKSDQCTGGVNAVISVPPGPGYMGSVAVGCCERSREIPQEPVSTNSGPCSRRLSEVPVLRWPPAPARLRGIEDPKAHLPS